MTITEATKVLELLFDGDDAAGKMLGFVAQFPDHADLAEKQWQETFGQEWEE